jgi:hypothetical protein
MTRENAALKSNQPAHDDVPAKEAVLSTRFKDTDASRVGSAKITDLLSAFSQYASRVAGHLVDASIQRPALGGVVGWPEWPTTQLRRDQDIINFAHPVIGRRGMAHLSSPEHAGYESVACVKSLKKSESAKYLSGSIREVFYPYNVASFVHF